MHLITLYGLTVLLINIDISASDCILFMWVTMPKLNECFEVIKKWGFEYKTCAFTWIKQNKKSNSLFWGMGRWTRANAELCLIEIGRASCRERV